MLGLKLRDLVARMHRMSWRTTILGISLWALLLACSGEGAGNRAIPLDRLVLSGIEEGVEIVYDEHGIPHVRAASETDAYFALGFLHGRDRLASMLWRRRIAQGRLSELIGTDGLASDRLARTLGFSRLAEKGWPALSSGERAWIRAYVAGINEAQRLRQNDPLIRELSRSQPEAWSPEDVLACLKLWSWGLDGSLEASLVLDDVLRALGPEASRLFFS